LTVQRQGVDLPEIAEHLFYRIGVNLLFRIGANLLFSGKGETPDNELVGSLLVPTLLLLLNDCSIALYNLIVRLRVDRSF